jgi:hypothetical protein
MDGSVQPQECAQHPAGEERDAAAVGLSIGAYEAGLQNLEKLME